MTQCSGSVGCVGALTYDPVGRLLLVQRAHDPGRGQWSLPGGRVEPGEDDATALIREMREETGLEVEPGPLVGRVQRGEFLIADYQCRVVGGVLRPGGDALAVQFVDSATLAQLPVTEGLIETLTEWNALPRC